MSWFRRAEGGPEDVELAAPGQVDAQGRRMMEATQRFVMTLLRGARLDCTAPASPRGSSAPAGSSCQGREREGEIHSPR